MLHLLRKFRYDVALALTYAVIVVFVHECYPIPQISWDSTYYIEKSIDYPPGIRPIGYSVFLSILHGIKPSLSFIVWVQYCIYFASLYLLLRVLRRYFVQLTGIWFYFLGVLMLLEPVGLYNCFNILSDLLFSTLSYTFVALLLLVVLDRKWYYMVPLAIVLFCCLETRHIALFYPFFAALAIVLLMRGNIRKVLYAATMLMVFFTSQKLNKDRNRKAFDVPIYSAFSGWTQANNALYAVPRISMRADYIKDPGIRSLHKFLKSYLDTTSYLVHDAGSDYMWDTRSPLVVIRQQVEDSIRAHHPEKLSAFTTMYHLAPLYQRYGLYIQKHFPYEFFMGFIVPNMNTLITPHDGEMMDYYVHVQMSQPALDRYGLKLTDFYCRKPIYKDFLNALNLKIYQLRLVVLAFCAGLIIYFRKKFIWKERQALMMLIAFIGLFYLLMLYTSWFMPRYILPVLPLFTAVIFLTVGSIIKIKYRRAAGS